MLLFYGHVMFIGNSQFIAGHIAVDQWKLKRFKMAADTLMAFAGDFFLPKK